MSQQFLFQGDFKRKPNQNLGGSSRTTEQRNALLYRAQMERERRERERLEAAATLRLQAFFRACLERKKVTAMLRQEFDSNRKSKTENIIRQMLLINRFFRHRADDEARLLDFGKQLLSQNKVVVEALKSDTSVIHPIKKILEKCVGCLNSTFVPPAVFLRLVDTYTNPVTYDAEDQIPSDLALSYVASIWIYLVQEADIFPKYRKFLENKLPPMRDETDKNRIVESYDYLMVYRRVFSMCPQLKPRSSINLCVGNKIYSSKDAVELIFLKFIDSFSSNVMPLFNNCGIARYFVLQELKSVVEWSEWASVLPIVCVKYQNNLDSLREIFYTTLLFLSEAASKKYDLSDLFSVIKGFLASIDPRNFPKRISQEGLTKQLRIWEEQMETEEEEEEMETPGSICYEQTVLIYHSMESVLNTLNIIPWLVPFQLARWELVCPILSVLIRLEPSEASKSFNWLSTLSYRRDFMRSFALHCMTTRPLSDDDLLVFCWLMQLLFTMIHDSEVIAAIPVSKNELAQLIVMFRDQLCDFLVASGPTAQLDPVFARASMMVAKLLMELHARNTRMHLFKEELFISSTVGNILPLETHNIHFDYISSTDAASVRDVWALSILEKKLLHVMNVYPFALSFHDRFKVWNRLLDYDKNIVDPNPMLHHEDVQIRRTYIYEDAYEKLSLENVQDIRKRIRISLVNVVGVMEAGIDGGGLLREFLTEATKAAVDPNRGLFRYDSHNRMYPNPVAKKVLPSFQKHFFVVGRLVGKALYEQILLELPLAAFFIQYCIDGKISNAVDFLATLDPGLHKQLLSLKTMPDVAALGLDFTISSDELGSREQIELKKNGRDIAVESNNVIEYIHLVADYKINKEVGEECRAFRAGLMNVIPKRSFSIFSWRELQTLISGSDKPIDIEDWRKNTNYGVGFSDTHPTVQMFWEVVKEFDEESLRMLLKFVTSCSRPPLLGFKDLIPKFGVQSAGNTDRLPTAATCMNLLKLPEFADKNTMKEKLQYVIYAQAGFELS